QYRAELRRFADRSPRRRRRTGRSVVSEQDGGSASLPKLAGYFPARSRSMISQWTTLSYNDWIGSLSSLPWARKSIGTTTQAPFVPENGMRATRNGRRARAA